MTWQTSDFQERKWYTTSLQHAISSCRSTASRHRLSSRPKNSTLPVPLHSQTMIAFTSGYRFRPTAEASRIPESRDTASGRERCGTSVAGSWTWECCESLVWLLSEPHVGGARRSVRPCQWRTPDTAQPDRRVRAQRAAKDACSGRGPPATRGATGKCRVCADSRVRRCIRFVMARYTATTNLMQRRWEVRP